MYKITFKPAPEVTMAEGEKMKIDKILNYSSKVRGELAVRTFSSKAQKCYCGTQPLDVYLTLDDKFYIRIDSEVNGPYTKEEAESWLECLQDDFESDLKTQEKE